MKKKSIALVAHDNRKHDLIEWAEFNRESLAPFKLICTGTTGALVDAALNRLSTKKDEYADHLKIEIIKLKSGPLGGDQQLGALIAEGEIDMLIFLWDPMQPQPHDVDVKALLRISSLYNIPTACNRSTADYIISSPLFNNREYKPKVNNFSEYMHRKLDI